ncbi:antitoxin MazE-like protein [Pseudarthrobacter sulfonivorans]|uniref:antitoxin MazE-like protein n=1 Tax=Pseudarthrobacter sulfonivorans TaxID=121292 RepID=UPI00168BD535
MGVRGRVARHRIAMRERGLRQFQMWVQDARTEEFKRAARWQRGGQRSGCRSPTLTEPSGAT